MLISPFNGTGGIGASYVFEESELVREASAQYSPEKGQLGGYKEMSSILPDQQGPRIDGSKCGGLGGLPSLSQ